MALLVVGLGITRNLANSYESHRQQDALDRAIEMGRWISNSLDEALLPLFTMSQFVKNLNLFSNLPFAIGHHSTDGSAPPLFGRIDTHRNVSGICDDPSLLKTFNDIAASVKNDAKLKRILVNIQLAPQSVVCLSYPIINTEDFKNETDERGLPILMNNTPAIGHDLLHDPARSAIARATVKSPDIVIAGPLQLIQGDVPVVSEALIARLAINIPNAGYRISFDGVDYPCWGFAVLLLNWAALKEKSGIDEIFEKARMEYHLTRTDRILNKTTGLYHHKVVTIATSKRHHVLNKANSVSTNLDTTNNMWTMTVGYEHGFSPPWRWALTLFVTITSFILSFMLMMVLVSKHQLLHLIYRMVPQSIVQRLRRGETVVERYKAATVLFSDIVGFTMLSGTMSPTDIMVLLNEIYTAFDALAAKHSAYKVETIGDAYILIGGGPDRSMGRVGAERVALFALDALDFVRNYRPQKHNNNNDAASAAGSGAIRIQIRVGLATGPCVGGVVGTTLPKFTLFGDIVNLASRMESTGSGMKIQCSEMTYRLLRDAPNYRFHFEERRDDNNQTVGVHVKGRGHEHTWWLVGATPLGQGETNEEDKEEEEHAPDRDPLSSSSRFERDNDNDNDNNNNTRSTMFSETVEPSSVIKSEEKKSPNGNGADDPFQQWFSS